MEYQIIISINVSSITTVYSSTVKCTTVSVSVIVAQGYPGPDLREGAKGPGPRPPTNKGFPTKPFIFYFSLMIDAYETTT